MFFAYRTITFYGQPFQTALLRVVLSLAGFSDFARHYFRNLGWCLFLELLRCFSSPGSLRMTMYSSCDTFAGGFPHSEVSGSKLICQLPEAYRRLSRPSSPIIAKASTTCSYSLDPITLTSLNDILADSFEIPSFYQGMFARSFTWRVMPYSITWITRISNVKFDIHFDAIKNLLLAARYALNLYECALSTSNAD